MHIGDRIGRAAFIALVSGCCGWLVAGCGGDDSDTNPQPSVDAGRDARPDGSDAKPDGVAPDVSADRGSDVTIDATPDVSVDADASPCPAGMLACGNQCVDPNLDNAHCGSCTNACPAGQFCSTGRCNLSCVGGTTQCSDRCVDTQSDRNNCGGCSGDAGVDGGGRVCAAGQVCSAGRCQTSCGLGLVNCGGKCIDPQTDRAFCGATGACGGDGGSAGALCAAGQICSAGTCQTSCGAGLVSCGGKCIDPLSDRNFCGAAGACGVDGGSAGSACNAGQVCSVGTCQLSCQSGLLNCGGKCVDPQTDRTFCGAAGSCGADGGSTGTMCAAGQVCSAGSCQLSCQQGLVNCGGKCVDPLNDRQYCGASGSCSAGDASSAGAACSAGQVCSAGSCQVTCQTGLVNCGGKCVDPLNDLQNCGATSGCGTDGGAAGSACASGQVCSAGVCRITCQAGLVNCNGRCIDPGTDRTFCGASGACAGASSGSACSAGQVCSAGTCRLSCQQGLVNCGGKCVDPQNDRTFCGASGACTGAAIGTACGAGQVCSVGQCQLTCQAGLVNCAGKCVDPQSDLQFCGATNGCGIDGGAAGAPCASGQVCSAGTCQLTCQQGLINCNGRCVDPDADRQFCGASSTCTGANSGTACIAGQVCSAGTCQLTCQQGLINCGGRCIDPTTDRTFCGASSNCLAGNLGAACNAGQVCSGGVCQLSCQTGLVNCNGTCIDPQNDRQFCGASTDCSGANSGAVCAAGQVCSTGVCRLSCQNGLVACAGRCVDPSTDRTNCGASSDCSGGNSGTMCSTGQVCSSGTCQLTCQAGLIACNGKCIDPQSDRQFCGASTTCSSGTAGAVCTAGQVCSTGTCQVSCQQGLVNCGGQCVDPTSDRTHCGASGDCGGNNGGAICALGQVCSAGTCQLSCQQGLVNCGGKCIDPLSDRQFCGASGACTGGAIGTPCANGQVCSNGSCQLSCQQGFISCGGHCIDPLTDRTFCGASSDCTAGNSGATCSSGSICGGGMCQVSCPGSQIVCSNQCVDPNTSQTHCGATAGCGSGSGSTGVACTAGQICSSGTCQATCASPLSPCPAVGTPAYCANLSSDVSNCGTCGNVCATGARCTSSACTCPGVSPAVCGGTCVDLSNDSNNCGGCANACTGGQICIQSICQVPPQNLDTGTSGTTTINTIRASAAVANGGTTVTVSNVNGTFAAGQLVLLHQTQGATGGPYNLSRIFSVVGSTITLNTPVTSDYVTDATHHAQILVVHEFTNVTVGAGSTLTAPAWDGISGGILAFQATGTTTVAGTIDMSGRGFRGTQHGCGFQCSTGTQGESYLGLGATSGLNNGPGGGAGTAGQDCSMGGGGAYGTVGEGGGPFANFVGFCGNIPPTPGAGGAVAGSANLTGAFLLGAAGGEGGGDEDGSFPGAGGNGGGAIVIIGNTLSVTGAITSAGLAGIDGVNVGAGCAGTTGCGMGGGGGGSGGAIRLNVNNATLGTGLVTAPGGPMGFCSCTVAQNGPQTGGNAGVGRIGVKALTVAGATSPAFDAH